MLLESRCIFHGIDPSVLLPVYNKLKLFPLNLNVFLYFMSGNIYSWETKPCDQSLIINYYL